MNLRSVIIICSMGRDSGHPDIVLSDNVTPGLWIARTWEGQNRTRVVVFEGCHNTVNSIKDDLTNIWTNVLVHILIN